MQGDAGNARAVYDAFFGLSKDTDSDIPILKQAQSGVREVGNSKSWNCKT
jgi:hypothetical protein